MKQRRDVTGLTGLGILLLLASGLGFSPISKGFLGIDVVFVCAGYIATREILKEYRGNAKHNRGYGWVTLGPFYARRLLYFIPSTLLTLSVVVLAVSFVNDPKYVSDVKNSAFFAALMLANVYFIHQGVDFLSRASDGIPLLNFWAISSYIQAILVYPLLLIAALGFKDYRINSKRVRHRHRAIYALTVITFVTVIITMVEITLEPKTAMFTATARLADFGIGGLFAAMRINEVSFGRVQLTFTRLGALSAILLSPLLFSNFAPNWASITIAIATGFVAGTHSSRMPDIFSRVLGAQPIYGLGVISPQIFLWYWPILGLSHRYGFHLGLKDSTSNRLFLGVLILLVSITAHFVVRGFVALVKPAPKDAVPTDDAEDLEVSGAGAESLTPTPKELVLQKTAYQKRNRVLVGAVVGSVIIATVSAPSILAPPVNNISHGPNPTPAASVSQVPQNEKPRVVFIGASVTSGCCTKSVPSWPLQVAQKLNWNITNLAKRGTGFTHGNKYGACADGTCRSFEQMAVRAIALHPDAVVVSGGRNDCEVTLTNPQRAQAAVNQTFDSLRLGLPYTPIIAMSVIYNQKDALPECFTRLNSWIAQSAAKHKIAFVSGASTWMVGHPEYMHADLVHPNDAGHTEIARRFTSWIKRENIRVVAGAR